MSEHYRDEVPEAPGAIGAAGKIGCVGWMIGILAAKALILLGVTGIFILPLALAGAAGVLLVFGVGWVIIRICAAVGERDNPLYNRWLAEGNDPYASTLPYPFNERPFEERGKLHQRFSYNCPGCEVVVTEAEPGDAYTCGIVCPICQTHFFAEDA